jgi:type IV pilus assembly protein PilQ
MGSDMPRKWFLYIQLCVAIFLFAAVCLSADENAVTEPLLSLSCKDSDIRDVLRGIAMQYGVNVVPDSSVTGTVTIHLQDAPFETGLATLLDMQGYEYEKRGDMYLVHAKADAGKNFQMSVQDENLTIDAEDADIRQLLRELSKLSSMNVVTESGVTGKITAHLTNVPVEDALYSILTANGFMVDEDNGIYRVRGGGVQQRGGASSRSIFYRRGKLSIDVKNAPVSDVLSDIASQAKINLVSVGSVQGNVTMRLDNVSLEQSMDALTDATGNVYTVVDDIYMVGDPTVRPGIPNPLLERKIIWLEHIEAQEVFSALPSNIPKTSITMPQDRNAVIVLGSRDIVQQIESFIEEIDIENSDIRSRQEIAVSVEVDDDGLLTIDAKDAPITMVLREISIRKGIDMTILGDAGVGGSVSRSVSRRRQRSQPAQAAQEAAAAPTRTRSGSGLYGEQVNFRISKATLEEAFDALFKGTAYSYMQEMGDTREFYVVGTGELLPGGGNPLIVSKKIELQYLNASYGDDVVNNIMDVLPNTIPDENIVVMEDQNAIVVMGTQKMVDEIESYIKQIDSPAPQIMIEALLIEITRGDSRDLGVSWSWLDDTEGNFVNITPGLSVAFDSLAGVPDNFFAALNALVSENKARVLAKPRVATTNGLQATMTVGWQEYFETTTEIYRGDDVPVGGYTRRGFNTLEFGVTLEITPWVGSAGDITVLIHPDIKDPKQVSKERSTITQRTLDTTVRVKDGETIVIGGLIQRNESTQENKVPVLGSIPLLGHLFKEDLKVQSDTELIIIVKPKIIEAGTSANIDVDRMYDETR